MPDHLNRTDAELARERTTLVLRAVAKLTTEERNAVTAAVRTDTLREALAALDEHRDPAAWADPRGWAKGVVSSLLR